MPWVPFGKTTVTTAGTPVRVTSTHTAVHAVFIEALPSNSGKIYIGSSTLNRSTLANCSAILPPPTANVFPSITAGSPPAPNSINIEDLWIDSDVNSDGVLVSYIHN